MLLKVSAGLNAQVAYLQTRCEPEEFHEVRQRFGQAMGELLEILNPIWREHPSLLPVPMGGSYVMPDFLLRDAVALLVPSP